MIIEVAVSWYTGIELLLRYRYIYKKKNREI
ncbi:hypothetical protein J2T12_003209 [Paenibacillus anaericanus]|nr:hypothetical protein [Paenibacillus anaericanus]